MKKIMISLILVVFLTEGCGNTVKPVSTSQVSTTTTTANAPETPVKSKAEDKSEKMAKQLVIVESAKIVVRDAELKALYPDVIQVIVKNISEKTIKNMKVSCLGYDKNGYPVKIKTQFSLSGGDYELVGNAEDANIIAGGKFGENRGWALEDQSDVSKVLACVKSATFYDGTTWDNPYYEYWIEQYKDKPIN